MQEVLEKGTLPEQFEYIEAKTRIYESYRAIYEEVFQKIRRNAVDSLSKAKGRITDLSMLRGTLENRIDSLNKSLSSTREDLDAVSRTKNSISVLGIELNKITYNSIMWLIVAGLAIVLGIGYVTFKRGLKITNSTKKELSDLKAEYDDYRQKSREAREKMSMDHFKEIQRLKGG
jgi:predicted  nucleic acid-binding Zn-ribbon protein